MKNIYPVSIIPVDTEVAIANCLLTFRKSNPCLYPHIDRFYTPAIERKCADATII